MAPRQSRSRIQKAAPVEKENQSGYDTVWNVIALLAPAILVFFTLRCAKNLCLLWYFPLTFPSRLEDYITVFSVSVVLGFIGSQMVWKRLFSRSAATDGEPDEYEAIPTSFSSFLFLSLVLVGISQSKPDLLRYVQDQHVQILVSVIVYCVVHSTVIAGASYWSFKAAEMCGLRYLFFKGPNIAWSNVFSEWFFFTHVGLIGWGVLDIVMFLNSISNETISLQVVFIFVTQMAFILHSLLFEKFWQRRAFMRQEKLSYVWMVKFIILMPFLGSLPMQHAISSDYLPASPADLCNIVFFLFGFLVFITSNHQMEKFLKDPVAANEMESVGENKLMLVSGYWSFVRRPDYLGLAIMWTSWTIACGPSRMSLLILAIVYQLVLLSAEQGDHFNRTKYSRAFKQYTSRVPRKLIPYIF